VPEEYTTRIFDENGQSEFEGVKLPAFHVFAVDLNWPTAEPPIINGDNQLTVRLVSTKEQGNGTVVIAELEFYVYVRGA